MAPCCESSRRISSTVRESGFLLLPGRRRRRLLGLQILLLSRMFLRQLLRLLLVLLLYLLRGRRSGLRLRQTLVLLVLLLLELLPPWHDRRASALVLFVCFTGLCGSAFFFGPCRRIHHDLRLSVIARSVRLTESNGFDACVVQAEILGEILADRGCAALG
jgi:hypothetical protein